MPELPEVQTTVNQIAPRLVARTITAFESLWAKNATPSAPAVRRGVVGRSVRAVSRRAKYVVVELNDGGWMLVHLRMSGRLEWHDPAADEPARHIRAAWTLDNGDRLLFCDARKFGRIVYTRSLDSVTTKLGVEPLSDEFTVERLAALLAARSRFLKPLLLDQSLIAGIGNIYADESLHAAGLHPLTHSDRIGPAGVAALHSAIQSALRQGLAHNGASIDWVYPGGEMQQHFAAYGRDGQACARCGDTIIALRVGQRGTHICPTCQPAPRGPRRGKRRSNNSQERACAASPAS